MPSFASPISSGTFSLSPEHAVSRYEAAESDAANGPSHKRALPISGRDGTLSGARNGRSSRPALESVSLPTASGTNCRNAALHDLQTVFMTLMSR